jgi:hypothetical protein
MAYGLKRRAGGRGGNTIIFAGEQTSYMSVRYVHRSGMAESKTQGVLIVLSEG